MPSVSDAPAARYLIAAMPARIFPPGKVPSYSTTLTLAGIHRRTSFREPFDNISPRILAPLGMDHSTFAQPLPESLEPEMSQGYLADRDREIEFVSASPAGAVGDSGGHVAIHAGVAEVRGLEGATILKPDSVRAMEVRHPNCIPTFMPLA